MKQGTIFDIKEFAVYDGPGIRQTIFFKGCPLRCNWCHNPEGLQHKPELLISTASCQNCGKCKKACPHNTCIACGKCIPACPLRLRKLCGTTYTSVELADIIRKDSDYYETYGGGVTFSGGEPLFQAEFLIEVLEQLSGIHTAIETSGYSEPEIFKKVITHIDYILMDIKIADPVLHKLHTGVDNEKILTNLKYLQHAGKPYVIRIPLIPGVNDTYDNYEHTASLLREHEYLEKVELLPYHKTAGAKYRMTGRTYEPKFETAQTVTITQNIFNKYGIRSSVL